MLDKDEVQYWNSTATKCIVQGNRLVFANIVKTRVLLRKILDFDFQDVSILEIGIGPGTIANCLKTIYRSVMNYQATDVSTVFADFCKNVYSIPVKHAEVTQLPYLDASFDWVFAFDSLEHVRPDQRLDGYKEINRVMKKNACIALNIPLDPSAHDTRFDHGYTYLDFVELLKTINAKMAQYNVYSIKYRNGSIRTYAFAVGERHL